MQEKLVFDPLFLYLRHLRELLRKVGVNQMLISTMIVILLITGKPQPSVPQQLLDPLSVLNPVFLVNAVLHYPFAQLQCPSTVGFGETIQCSIDSSGDVDSFTFPVNSGDRVLVRVSKTSGSLWPGVRIEDSGGANLCQAGSAFTAEISTCDLPSAGNYTILVYDSYLGTYTGDYTLYLQRLNNPGNSLAIDYGQLISGSLANAAEMETYRFSGEAGDKILVRMSKTSGDLWPGIRVYAPDGTKACEQGGTTPTAEISTCDLPSAGNYTILVYDSYLGTYTGEYTLYLQRLNNPGNAEPITFGQVLTGTISAPAMMNAYIFSAEAGASVLVQVSKISGSLWPGIRVYDSKGDLLCQDSGVPDVEMTGCSIETYGNYLLLVYDSYNGTLTGNYNLAVDVGWYVGQHSAAPIAFGQEGPIRIKVNDSLSQILEIRGDPTCLPHEAHAFVYDPGLTLPIADGRFFALGIPLDIPASPGHAHSMDIDGVFFDTNGDGKPDQGYGGFTFRSGADVCEMHWAATALGPDTDSDGWSDAAETALGSKINDGKSTPENQAVPTTLLTSTSVCEDIADNDGDGQVDTTDSGCPAVSGLKLDIQMIAPERASSGQEFTYLVKYANNGSKTVPDALVFVELDENLQFVSASNNPFYNNTLHSVEWEVGSLPPGGKGELSLDVEVEWGVPFGTVMNNSAVITVLEPLKTSQVWNIQPLNLYVNGIGNCPDSVTWKKNEEFANLRNAAWYPVYMGITHPLLCKDPIDDIFSNVINANNNIADEDNGLNSILPYNYDTCWAYSGGTVTIVTVILHRNVRCNHLVLISPFLTDAAELDSIIALGTDITIYQSDADLPSWIQKVNGACQVLYGGDCQYKVPSGDPFRSRAKVIDVPGAGHGDWMHCFNYAYSHDGDPNRCTEADNRSAKSKTQVLIARDPNAKSVNKTTISPGESITFTIEFENEGEGTAYGVYIDDTLDEDLDASTLEFFDLLPAIVDSYHYDEKTHTITWYIGQVDPHSGGEITYTVAARASAPINTLITNYATVYFPSVPEMTNTNGVAVFVVTPKIYLPIVRKQ